MGCIAGNAIMREVAKLEKELVETDDIEKKLKLFREINELKWDAFYEYQ